MSEAPHADALSKPASDAAIGVSPLVCIGIPVYNEERFLERSVKALLAQDYENIKLTISDNASTDGTEGICRDLLQSDGRIDYRRMECNQGVVENFRQVLGMASGKYFMWASGHDLWQSNYVTECVRLLEREPEAVIAYGASNWIDVLGNLLPKTSGYTDTRGMDAIARFHTLLWGNMHPILGLIRADALGKTRNLVSTAGTDLILLSELALQGHFVHAVETSWSRREIRANEDYQQRMARYSEQEYALSRSFIGRLTPLLRLPVELVRSVLRSELSMPEKLLLLLSFIPVLPAKYLVTRTRQERNGRR